MQQEFYIGQKVKTSQAGIEKGFPRMHGNIIAVEPTGAMYSGWFRVEYETENSFESIGIFMPEEIEPIEDSSISEIVFDNIVKSL